MDLALQGAVDNTLAAVTEKNGNVNNPAIARRGTKSKPKWVPDEESLQCLICKEEFWLLNRRHHCRRCGTLCCDACSVNRMKLAAYYGCGDEPVRVCSNCFGRASVDEPEVGKPVEPEVEN
jgi:hypothetical protein